MIRKMEKEDRDRVSKIWLDTNIKAHDFIPSQYWENNYEPVREMLPQAEVYVWEENGQIQGFCGPVRGLYCRNFCPGTGTVQGDRRAAFGSYQSKKAHLSLKVYQKNTRAVKFYKREGFQIKMESADQETGEKEYTMEWHS